MVKENEDEDEDADEDDNDTYKWRSIQWFLVFLFAAISHWNWVLFQV